MSGPIHLYVSSSYELAAEREMIGQIVAALPVSLGWQISHTPLSGPLDAMLGNAELDTMIQECDLYAVVLGRDLSAPMGYEVRTALARRKRAQSGYTADVRLVGAYRKECTRSPSAQDAVRTLEVTWQPYAGVEAFSTRFKRDLAQALLDIGPGLGLDLADAVRLLIDRWIKGGKAPEREGEGGEEHAGRGARILGREVWQAGAQGEYGDSDDLSPA
jgi:hypothetical protein